MGLGAGVCVYVFQLTQGPAPRWCVSLSLGSQAQGKTPVNTCACVFKMWVAALWVCVM